MGGKKGGISTVYAVGFHVSTPQSHPEAIAENTKALKIKYFDAI
jgi:hypothetical protein